MAFVTTETNSFRLAGFTPAVILITGTYASSAGGTGGVIAPGYTNASGTLTAKTGTASVGAYQILADWYVPTTNDATAPGSAISYNSTIDKWIATQVTTADSTGRYFLICTDNGSA